MRFFKNLTDGMLPELEAAREGLNEEGLRARAKIRARLPAERGA